MLADKLASIESQLTRVERLYRLKHMPGEHDQQRHAPVSVTRGSANIPKGQYDSHGSGSSRWQAEAQMLKLAGVKNYKDANKAGWYTIKVGDAYHIVNTKKPIADEPAPMLQNTDRERQALIQRRLEIGTSVKLSADARKSWEEGVRDIRSIELLDSADQIRSRTMQKGTKWEHESSGYFITPDDKLVDLVGEFGGGSNDHVGFAAASEHPELFGLSDKDANDLLASYMDMSTSSMNVMNRMWKKMHKAGVIRIRHFGDETNFDTHDLDTATLKRLKRLVDEGKLKMTPGVTNYWESYTGSGLNFTYEQLMSSKNIDQLKWKIERESM